MKNAWRAILPLLLGGCGEYEPNEYPVYALLYVKEERSEPASRILAGRSRFHLSFGQDTSDRTSCEQYEFCRYAHVELIGESTYLGRKFDTLRLDEFVGGFDPLRHYLFDETFSVQSDSLVVRVFTGSGQRIERRTVYRFQDP